MNATKRTIIIIIATKKKKKKQRSKKYDDLTLFEIIFIIYVVRLMDNCPVNYHK